MTNPDGSIVTQNYTNGFLVSTVHSVLGTTSYTYDPHGRLHSETHTIDGVPRTTSYTYDANDQVLTITDPANRVTTYTYDAMGRRTQVDLPGGRTVNYEYHPTGELKKTWGSDTYPVEYAYDPAGRMKTLKTWQDFTGNPNAPAVTTWNYDPVRGFLASKTYHDGQGPSYTYYADGRLHTRTWARGGGLTTTYTYDNGGMLSGVDYSDATPDVTYVTRDRMGHPTQITDGIGTHNLTYYPDSSPDTVSLPQVAAGFILDYGNEEDTLKRRSSLNLKDDESNTLFTHSYTYDGMSRLHTVGDGANLATYSRVSGSSQLATTTINNGSSNVLTVTRAYDSLDRLTGISSATSAVEKSFTYLYNDRDQKTKCTLVDGSYWEYSYDDLGQVTSGIKKSADGTSIPGQSFGYDFDDIGNRKTEQRAVTGANYSYTANLLNQYAQRTVPGLIPVIGTANADTIVKIHRESLGDGPNAFLDPARNGNIFSLNIPVDNSSGPVTEEIDVYCHKHLTDPDKEIAAKESRTVTVPGSPEEFHYDDDGNLLSDGLWTYTWDAENRLSEAICNVGASACWRKLEFSYDFQSRRVAKKTYSWDTDHWSLITDHRFAWDGWILVATFNAANELQQSFLWGEDLSGSLQGAGGVGGLLAVSTFSPQPSAYLPLYDGNGNIMAYIDAADGTTAATFEYDPFGNTIAATGTAPCAFRFSTKPLDAETGLYYYGYRYYSHEIGRWLGRDPIGEMGGHSLYAMVGNCLVNEWDLLGMANSNSITARGSGNESNNGLRMEIIHNLFAYRQRIMNTAPTYYQSTRLGPFFDNIIRIMVANDNRLFYMNMGWTIFGGSAEFIPWPQWGYGLINFSSVNTSEIIHELSHAKIFFGLGMTERRDEGLASASAHVVAISSAMSAYEQNIRGGYRPSGGFKADWDRLLERVWKVQGYSKDDGIFYCDRDDFINVKIYYGYHFKCKRLAKEYNLIIKQRFGENACLDCESIRGYPLYDY